MLTPPILVSPFSEDVGRAVCYSEHLNRTEVALHSDSSSYNVNDEYEIYTDCMVSQVSVVLSGLVSKEWMQIHTLTMAVCVCVLCYAQTSDPQLFLYPQMFAVGFSHFFKLRTPHAVFKHGMHEKSESPTILASWIQKKNMACFFWCSTFFLEYDPYHNALSIECIKSLTCYK